MKRPGAMEAAFGPQTGAGGAVCAEGDIALGGREGEGERGRAVLGLQGQTADWCR